MYEASLLCYFLYCLFKERARLKDGKTQMQSSQRTPMENMGNVLREHWSPTDHSLLLTQGGCTSNSFEVKKARQSRTVIWAVGPGVHVVPLAVPAALRHECVWEAFAGCSGPGLSPSRPRHNDSVDERKRRRPRTYRNRFPIPFAVSPWGDQ